MSITQNIFQSFDKETESRAIFLDISKAFDKIWHEGFIYMLCQYGFTETLLTLSAAFLSSRKWRVVLNDQHSSWADIKASASQVSILGPPLFLLHINDLTETLHSNPKLISDDTSSFSIVTDAALSNSHLNDDVSKINDWAYRWKISFNPDSTKPTHEVISLLYPEVSLGIPLLWKILIILYKQYIMSNFIPNETMTFDDWDTPWLNKNIKICLIT